MTFKPLTADRGAELLTSYLAAFHAKTSAPQERAQESTEPDPECGVTWRELLAKYDPDTSMWKTAHSSLLEDSIEFSGTWPRWGLMRDGVSYQRQTLVPRTKGTGSGSLVWIGTPTATMSERSEKFAEGRTPSPAEFVKKWPTPISQDAKHSGYAQSGPGKADKLSYAVVRWPTPTAHNSKEGAYPAEFTRNTPTLSAQAGGTLNPTWVEWLMGWPLGWTDLKPLAMDKYQQWQQQHGGF